MDEEILVDKLVALFNNFGKNYERSHIQKCLKDTKEKISNFSKEEITDVILKAEDPEHIYISCKEFVGKTTKEEQGKFIDKTEGIDIGDSLFWCLVEKAKYLGSGTTSVTIGVKIKKFGDQVLKFIHGEGGAAVMMRGYEERKRDLKMSKEYPDSFAKTFSIVLIDPNGDIYPMTMQQRLYEEKIYEIIGTVEKGLEMDVFFEKYVDKLYKYAKNENEFKRMLEENPEISGFAFDKEGYVRAFDYA